MKRLEPAWTGLRSPKLCDAYRRIKTAIVDPAVRIRFDWV